MNYLQKLVEEFHSATVATLDFEGRPQTRIIDMMHYDESGVYFLTARGKEFYRQLTEQDYIALSAVKDKMSISLRGYIRNIGSKNLDIMFEKNPYMKEIYPGDTRRALDVFCLYEAEGEFFDISEPSRIVRERITISERKGRSDGIEAEAVDMSEKAGASREIGAYSIGEACTGCGACAAVCPQHAIEVIGECAKIDARHCLHCGLCEEACPRGAVKRLQ